MDSFWVYGVGLVAQLLFSARLIVQWVRSEKAGRSLSPTIFWQLSLIASFLLIIYGILRNDLVIILGQGLSYFVYIRNLQYKHAWRYIPRLFKYVVVLFPFVAILWLTTSDMHSWQDILQNEEISKFMLTWGTAGQAVFVFRFVYQWYYSEKEKRSVLPAGFWWISIIGALMIISYGIYRLDPVLILGQAFGFVIYGRNLLLYGKNKGKK